MNNIIFANKEYFWLLLILIPMIAWYIWRLNESNVAMKIGNLSAFNKTRTSWKSYFRHLLFILRIFALITVIFALARPQRYDKWEEREIEGIDIVIAIDISGSMLAEDLKPNRLETAKELAIEFITNRPNDRIGLVAFSSESFTQCPLTIDHATLINSISQVKSGMIDDGTAIGLAIANSTNRLKDSKADSKVVILLTDGINNMGNISPSTAADFAKEYGIRIHTVAVGKRGFAPFPYNTPFGIKYQQVEVEIDEEILQEIANKTGGQYFRAVDNKTLKDIYSQIDELEKTNLDVKSFSKTYEDFQIFILFAILFIALEQLLGLTILKNTF